MKTDGERLATLEEQNRWLMHEMKEARRDIKSLLSFKWKAVGVGIAFGALGSFAFEVVKGWASL